MFGGLIQTYAQYNVHDSQIFVQFWTERSEQKGNGSWMANKKAGLDDPALVKRLGFAHSALIRRFHKLYKQRLVPVLFSKFLEFLDIANKFGSGGFKHMQYNLYDKICLILL